MSLCDPFVQFTDSGDGSGKFTISFADEDHRFTVFAQDDNNTAIVNYEETLSWRGDIRVSEPDEIVYGELMRSDKMTEFLEQHGLSSVRRAYPKK